MLHTLLPFGIIVTWVVGDVHVPFLKLLSIPLYGWCHPHFVFVGFIFALVSIKFSVLF